MTRRRLARLLSRHGFVGALAGGLLVVLGAVWSISSEHAGVQAAIAHHGERIADQEARLRAIEARLAEIAADVRWIRRAIEVEHATLLPTQERPMGTVARSVEVCDAVVAELNSEFSLGAARKWLVAWTLQELVSLRVTVTPGPLTTERVTRGRVGDKHDVDIALQQKINPDTNAPIDALVLKVEQLLAHFVGKKLTTPVDSLAVQCVLLPSLVPGTESAVSRELLEDKRCFTAVIRTTWSVLTQT